MKDHSRTRPGESNTEKSYPWVGVLAVCSALSIVLAPILVILAMIGAGIFGAMNYDKIVS